MDSEVSLYVNGEWQHLVVDTRMTLLDLLRERLGNMSPKKGCDHGQCGACTVLIDGRRALACLALAVAHDGSEVVTADGLAHDGALHPVAQAFPVDPVGQRRPDCGDMIGGCPRGQTMAVERPCRSTTTVTRLGSRLTRPRLRGSPRWATYTY